jgi:hypothetical protein
MNTPQGIRCTTIKDEKQRRKTRSCKDGFGKQHEKERYFTHYRYSLRRLRQLCSLFLLANLSILTEKQVKMRKNNIYTTIAGMQTVILHSRIALTSGGE